MFERATLQISKDLLDAENVTATAADIYLLQAEVHGLQSMYDSVGCMQVLDTRNL